MVHTIVRLRGVRMAVVLVERRQLISSEALPLICSLQILFQLPVMLVANDETAWNNARAVAEFDAMPYLFELLPTIDELEWADVPMPVEIDVPF